MVGPPRPQGRNRARLHRGRRRRDRPRRRGQRPRLPARLPHATTDKRACGEPADPGTWAEIQPRPATATDPLDIVVPVDTASGTRSFAPGQWLTTGLQDLGRFDVSLQLFQAATDLLYDCVVHAGQASCGALQQSDVSGGIVPGESF